MQAAYTPHYGPPSIIELRDAPTPSVEAGEVLIRIHASPVTEGDRRLRSADFPGMTALFGRLAMGLTGPRKPIQGSMFAGEVVEVGAEVSHYAVGDRVFGEAEHGAYAEYLRRPADSSMAKQPEGMSADEVAALPYGAGTALIFLRDLAELQANENVLILGASGGVGRYAVQIAKSMGARVTGVCSQKNVELVRSLGADETLDYASEDFTQQDTKYDVIFDIADATTFPAAKRVLTPNGRYLTLYMSFGVLFHMLWTSLFGTQKALFSVAMPTPEHIETLADLAGKGVITPNVAKRFPLAQIGDAHTAAEGSLSGEVIVTLTPVASGA
ncbi:MAG: NAD(P)-dependent alcohol dehydrogenase [Proteobacteria bacterium]|nr:NAD(P)-dependent alcohol dehydrogenase [Pseudomonadota bacterium]